MSATSFTCRSRRSRWPEADPVEFDGLWLRQGCGTGLNLKDAEPLDCLGMATPHPKVRWR